MVTDDAPTPAPAAASASPPPASVFDRIALSLSGGGFRASAYSLGTLKGLYLLGLLDNVHMLSTASGGTITGAYYAMRRKFGDDFTAIYADFYQLLAQDSLLPNALARWEQGIAAGQGYKLIQAFAEEYNQLLYGEARLGMFWEPDTSAAAPFHLQSLIFGATEMGSGLTFRFQHGAFLPPPAGADKECYAVGTGNVSLPWSHARRLRLADVVAASSCFPGGFEPLVLPDDFFPGPPDPTILRGRVGSRYRPGRVALLDGGIYDNQGIESLLLANRRNREHADNPRLTPQQAALLQPSTLFLVADVSSADQQIYQAPPLPPRPRYSPTVQQLALGGLLLLLLLGAAAGLLARAGWPFAGGLLGGLALVGAGVAVGIGWLWGQLGRLLAGVGDKLPGWVQPRLRRLSLRQLGYLLRLRAGSTARLLTSVFMRRVRSLNYEQLYRRLGRSTASAEVMSSIIGGLVTDYERWQARPRRTNPPKTPKVGEQLAAVYPTIRSAHQMPTTLWWQHDLPRLPAVVASAEITLYYQMLRRFEKTPPRPGTGEAEVQRRAQLLWAAYQPGGENFLLPLTVAPRLADPACTVAELLASNE